jgi:hypothetical protein
MWQNNVEKQANNSAGSIALTSLEESGEVFLHSITR